MAREEQRPLPEPTAVSAPFWRGAAERRLLIQQCADCGTFQHPPKVGCHKCWGEALVWRESDGAGTVCSFTIVRRSMTPGFIGEEPYVVAMVDLPEGVRLTTNIIGCDVEAIRIGMAVEPSFAVVSEEIGLIHFRPRRVASFDEEGA